MNETLLIEPHLDDAVLFASYTIMREKPAIVTVLGGTPDVKDYYGTPYSTRRHEQELALFMLGHDPARWTCWGNPEEDPDWDEIRHSFKALRLNGYTKVWAPRPEPGGHEQHNRVARLVAEQWPHANWYMTYRRGNPRSRGTIVLPQPGWRARKLRAMSCYSSQIDLDATRPWFAADDALLEWHWS